MPNFDTGHYFLTVLAPIRNGTVPRGDADKRAENTSYLQQLRQQLALLPTALQSPATEAIGINAPFTRDLRTHFTRMVVITDVVFNGRTHYGPIADALRGHDPLAPQKTDNLTTGYLLWTVDFDAVIEIGDPLPHTLSQSQQDAVREAYLRQLWDVMEEELRAIFGHCVGFDTVRTRSDFAAYIARCQVETTMPFNDYWLETPKLASLNVRGLGAIVLAPAALTALALISWLVGAQHVLILSLLVALPSGWTCIAAGALTALAVWLAYRYVLNKGARPMPPGPYADLPSVLKSLYVQQTFSSFAIEHQGESDADIHAAFGDFVARHQPDNRHAPSQRPGFIAIDRQGAILTAANARTGGVAP